MKTLRSGLFIVTLLLNYIGTGYILADEIYLKNGDKISGEVLNMKDNKLSVKTSYAGEIGIKWSEIAGMKTDKEILVVLKNERWITGEIQLIEQGKLKLSGAKIAKSVTISISDVKSINLPIEEKLKIKSRANMGISSTRGNTNKDTSHFDGEISARTEYNRYIAGGELNRTESGNIETENNSLGYLKYDHFLSKNWFVYGNARFEKDKLKDLKLRSGYGIGSGYQFFETPITNLYLEAGITYVTEDYVTATDNNYTSGRWAVNYDRYYLDKTFQFFHFHEGYGSLENSDDFFIKSRTGVRIPLFTKIIASMQVNLDWDNNPPPGRKHFDRALMITLGYQFEK